MSENSISHTWEGRGERGRERKIEDEGGDGRRGYIRENLSTSH